MCPVARTETILAQALLALMTGLGQPDIILPPIGVLRRRFRAAPHLLALGHGWQPAAGMHMSAPASFLAAQEQVKRNHTGRFALLHRLSRSRRSRLFSTLGCITGIRIRIRPSARAYVQLRIHPLREREPE